MFYLIDKPIGMTSFDVIRSARKILNTKKIGHTGTLDPLASGLLLIATENSTKLIPELEWKKKRYHFSLRLDGCSDSLDLGTPVRAVSLESYQERTQEELISFLREETSQIPPKYSALHVWGKRAYALVRDGIEFELRERPITIDAVEIHEFSPPETITLSLMISSGGYIRSLAPRVGSFFWVDGGYITELRRTEISLQEGAILNLDQVEQLEKYIHIPYSILFPTIPTLDISFDQSRDLQNGKNIFLKNVNHLTLGKYFLNYLDEYISLCLFDGEKFTIIRNNV